MGEVTVLASTVEFPSSRQMAKQMRSIVRSAHPGAAKAGHYQVQSSSLQRGDVLDHGAPEGILLSGQRVAVDPIYQEPAYAKLRT